MYIVYVYSICLPIWGVYPGSWRRIAPCRCLHSERAPTGSIHCTPPV